MENRDNIVLSKIVEYCDDINDTLARFGDELEQFIADKDFQKSICMSLVQIGELTTHFSEEFIQDTQTEIDWRGTKRLRNIVVHNYGSINYNTIWEIVKFEIPDILSFCRKEMQKHTEEQ